MQSYCNVSPNGLPLIIKGNSGVGKSFLASLIYQYALDRKVIHNDAKFVVVNCADYANNPELLSAVLFGYKKEPLLGLKKILQGCYLLLMEDTFFR